MTTTKQKQHQHDAIVRRNESEFAAKKRRELEELKKMNERSHSIGGAGGIDLDFFDKLKPFLKGLSDEMDKKLDYLNYASSFSDDKNAIEQAEFDDEKLDLIEEFEKKLDDAAQHFDTDDIEIMYSVDDDMRVFSETANEMRAQLINAGNDEKLEKFERLINTRIAEIEEKAAFFENEEGEKLEVPDYTDGEKQNDTIIEARPGAETQAKNKEAEHEPA